MDDRDHFTFTLDQNANEVFRKVRKLAEANDIQITGDNKKGHFKTGILEGTYEVFDREIRISVTDKPYLVDRSNMENLLKDLFSGNDSRDYKEIFGYMNLKRF
jgi:hypothetical protein